MRGRRKKLYSYALMLAIGLSVLYIGVPLIVLWLSGRYKWVEKVGTVTLCYIAGIVAGNIPGLNVPEETVAYPMYVLVLLSIPLLLFSSDFSVWRRMGAVLALSFLFCVVAVTIAVIAGTLVFKNRIEDVWILSSMLMGIYTGGAPNLAAIGLSLGVDTEAFLVVSGVGILYGGIWLLVLLTNQTLYATGFHCSVSYMKLPLDCAKLLDPQRCPLMAWGLKEGFWRLAAGC